MTMPLQGVLGGQSRGAVLLTSREMSSACWLSLMSSLEGRSFSFP